MLFKDIVINDLNQINYLATLTPSIGKLMGIQIHCQTSLLCEIICYFIKRALLKQKHYNVCIFLPPLDSRANLSANS